MNKLFILIIIFIIFILFNINFYYYEKYKNISSKNISSKNISSKNIFIYWKQGFDKSPYIVEKCVNSWIEKNKDFKIHLLDDHNIKDYIDIQKEIPNINQKNISITSLSDIIRIFLLEKYGGCWCDSTTYCNVPLNEWLYKYSKNGFFAFEKHNKYIYISSWFLYGEKNNYIIKALKQKVIDFVKKNNNIGINSKMKLEYWNSKINNYNNYFWFHYLFTEIYKNDEKIRYLWDNIKKINTLIPHYIQHKGLLNKVNQNIKEHIKNKKSPMYKLTYKYNHNKYNNGCILYYLLEKKSL